MVNLDASCLLGWLLTLTVSENSGWTNRLTGLCIFNTETLNAGGAQWTSNAPNAANLEHRAAKDLRANFSKDEITDTIPSSWTPRREEVFNSHLPNGQCVWECCVGWQAPHWTSLFSNFVVRLCVLLLAQQLLHRKRLIKTSTILRIDHDFQFEANMTAWGHMPTEWLKKTSLFLHQLMWSMNVCKWTWEFLAPAAFGLVRYCLCTEVSEDKVVTVCVAQLNCVIWSDELGAASSSMCFKCTTVVHRAHLDGEKVAGEVWESEKCSAAVVSAP